MYCKHNTFTTAASDVIVSSNTFRLHLYCCDNNTILHRIIYKTRDKSCVVKHVNMQKLQLKYVQ